MPPNEKVTLHGADGEFTYAQLASNVERELTRALNREKRFGLTRAEVANRLNVDKSFVTRCMSGSGNLTLRTVAALFAAMGYQVEVSARRIEALPDAHTSNQKGAAVPVSAVRTIASTATLAAPGNAAGPKLKSFVEFGT